jgi:hypothetical protein
VYTTPWGRADAYGVGMLLYMVYDYHLGDKKRRAEEAARELSNYDLFIKYTFWVLVVGAIGFGLFYLAADNTDWWIFGATQYNSFTYFLWSIVLVCVSVSIVSPL